MEKYDWICSSFDIDYFYTLKKYLPLDTCHSFMNALDERLCTGDIFLGTRRLLQGRGL